MIIGLDKSFKPIWVYKILQLSKTGLEFKQLKEEFLDIIDYEGLIAKQKTLTIIRRYYLKFEKINKKEVFTDNYLHNLSLKYPFEHLKPVLLFVLLFNCPIAQFLQSKINVLFIDQEIIDNIILHDKAKEIYGDRRVVKFAVTYYLKILSYFDIFYKEKLKYRWKNQKLILTDDILKEILILYAQLRNDYEIDIDSLEDEVSFSLFNLDNIERISEEFNTINWIYQKRFDSKKIIIKNKYKNYKI